ncbi:LTA synthase family protein [Gelidibacter salicanalis]|uniref:Sulfatase n=1 Tax=Gelidibacter salicanalis TaxID=291193 RepID=A0A934NIK4_9FLAO|nr:sulfatase [Gelidibacter salicanalis]MBJ7880184.1 sulfatase [Gelidibacter salicanalis]
MNTKCRLLIITIIFFFLGSVHHSSSAQNTKVLAQDSLAGLNSKLSILEKEINYIAPQSGSVYLAWSIEDLPLGELAALNDNTKLTDGLLYTPMYASGDTFKIKIKIPQNYKLNYNFWITKNKQGHYIDYWDLKSNGQILIVDDAPLTKTAHYAEVRHKTESKLLTKGWLVLIFFTVVLLVLYIIQKKRMGHIKPPSHFETIVFLSISLILLQALARSEIVGFDPVSYTKNPKLIVKVIRASFSDFNFVVSITIVVGLATLLIKSTKIKNAIRVLFILFAVLATVAAFSNITTVILLGKPFTYQWLYYSDFLGSDEAKTALQENISISIIVNLIAYCISLFLLAKILHGSYKLLTAKKNLKYITLSLLGLTMVVLVFFSFKTQVIWSKGQAENPITAFVHSMVTANSNASFFVTDLSADEAPFDPAKSTPLKTPLILAKDHQVKNVLFIVLESAGSAYFDAYGGNFQLSPNLNKYAKQALIFDQMYAHSPATNFSLVSILASMYPDLSFKSITQENPDIDHPTLSSLLNDKGYRTSFFTSADLRFQNCDAYLAHRGFDTVEDFSKISCDDQFHLADKTFTEGNGINDLCLADRLSSWLDTDTTQNFFSMLWTVQGHYPYFFEDEEQDFGVSNLSFNRYLNCLKRNDELVGMVMQMLEDRGLAESTLVVVTGDHGEAFGQHSQYGHGSGIYEENLKVPLYFINSTLFNGERVTDIASMKDLATTVLPVIGVDIPETWQGRDLLSTSSTEGFYFAPWSDYLFGYRNGDLKYIFNETENTVEVYNLKKDPKELNNLYTTEMEVELINARSKVAAWVQFQDKFMKQLLKEDQ